MHKTKLETLKIDSEIAKEYQLIIRKLQEELYNIKNFSAVQEDSITKLKENEISYLEEIVFFK